MAVAIAAPVLEHLTPHDLVTYYRCPHEMELVHTQRASQRDGAPSSPRTPRDVVPLHRSPLVEPPHVNASVNGGRFDVFPQDSIVYQDEGEDDLPMLFAPNQVRLDSRFLTHNRNLIDSELGLSGRPDLVVRRGDQSYAPIEYKSTHPFHGLHATHGRAFDIIQVLAECRLVAATVGALPRHGYLIYGDAAGDGQHEGWIEVPYGPQEDAWITNAVRTVRADNVRAPVPHETNCSSCAPHRDGLCPYAASRYQGATPIGGGRSASAFSPPGASRRFR
ncbi:MAG: hypothetical protein L3K03_07090 [Thermoplasmata archaeon]|nr:hypothetical protein [Thermoplasmata archaeon]